MLSWMDHSQRFIQLMVQIQVNQEQLHRHIGQICVWRSFTY